MSEHILFESQADDHDLHIQANRRQRYVGAVRAVSEVIGRVPASTDYLAEYERRRDAGNERLPSLSAVVKFFGGWGAVLAASGLAAEPEPTRIRRARSNKAKKIDRYPTERLIECLQAAGRDLSRAPTFRAYLFWREDKLAGRPGARPVGSDIPHARTIDERFGSWTAGLRAAGFRDPARSRASSREYSTV